MEIELHATADKAERFNVMKANLGDRFWIDCGNGRMTEYVVTQPATTIRDDGILATAELLATPTGESVDAPSSAR